MADTYGRGPNGEMTYAPSQYDQWGVYMGNRAPMVGQSNVSTPGFNQWSNTQPFEEWLPQYAKTQLARGRGSLGPEVTAPQGTPEYRQQVAAREQAAQWIVDRGGTVGDMGIRPAKGAGLNLWNQFSGYKGGQYGDRFRAQARSYYDKAMAQRGGAGGDQLTNGTGQFGTGGGSDSRGSFAPGVPLVANQAVPTAVPTTANAAPPAYGANSSDMVTDPVKARGLRGLLG
jgi:hypothetical protein